MGADIHSFVEIQNQEGVWLKQDSPFFSMNKYWDNTLSSAPFWWRQYEVFAFLANVRNEFGCDPIVAPKGMPKDSPFLNAEIEPGYTVGHDLRRQQFHSFSWLTVQEMLAFNYEAQFYNHHLKKHITYAEFIGERYFTLLEELQILGTPTAVRVVYFFDS